MSVKKHLRGGTIHKVIVNEIKRVLNKYQDQGQVTERAAVELGVTPRTLRLWMGPVEKGGWTELQGFGGMERLTNAMENN